VPNKKQYAGLDMNGYKVTGLPAPSAPTDAATKEWVEQNAGGSPLATNVQFTPETNTFPTGTDNVDGALKHLFTYANSGKNDVADSIGYAVPYSDTFASLAGNIDTTKTKLAGFLPKAEQTILSTDKLHELANKLDDVRVFKKRTKLRKASGSTETVPLSKNIVPEQFTMNVLRLNGDTLITPSVFTADFDNGDDTDFFTNPKLSFINNRVEIPIVSRQVTSTGTTIKQFVIDLSTFDDAKITSITDTMITYQTIDTAQVLVASGDIDISNVGDFSGIKLLTSNSTTSTANPSFNNTGIIIVDGTNLFTTMFALSFDSGTTWYGYRFVVNPEFPIFNNINDTNEWLSKGAPATSMNSFTQSFNTLFETLRNGSNTLKFAYYIRSVRLGYTVYLDQLVVDGFLRGTLEPAGTSATVAYNSVNKTATVTFNTQDTYQINWIDT
jgi:hypothetical protein